MAQDPLLAVLQAVQVAVQSVATQAQLQAAFAPLAPMQEQLAQLAPMQAQLAQLAPMQAQLAQLAPMQAQLAQLAQIQAQVQAQLAQLTQIQAQMQAQLAPLNIPVIVAAATQIVRDITAACRDNVHVHDDPLRAFTIVPLSNGNLPANWPPGFNRTMLLDGPIAAVDQLLASYGLPNGAAAGNAKARRNALAVHIGAVRS